MTYWINAMDKYFECRNVDDDKKVIKIVTILKSHASLWWDGIQAK